MRKDLVILCCVCTLLLTRGLTLAVPSNGLIGHWPLDGDANDTSGNGHNGTIVGATSISGGVTGSAYHFDGQSYIDVGDLLFPNSKFSVSVWVKSQTQCCNNFAGAIAKLDNSAGGPFELGDGYTSTSTYTGPFALTWNGGIGVVNIEQPKLTLLDGRWHMITYTYKNDGQILYVDGAMMGTSRFAGPLPVTTNAVRIGGYSFGPYHHPWNGDIDEVLIYGRPLTKVEVLQIYQEIVPPPA